MSRLNSHATKRAHPNEATTGAYLEKKRIEANPWNYVSLNWDFLSDKPLVVIGDVGFKDHMFNFNLRL